MVNGAVWTPLVFLFLVRAARGVHAWASASLSGACIGMAWLAGHHQVPIFLTLASGGVWLYYILKEGRPDWRMTRLAATAMVFAPVVGALQILPAQEYGRLAWRWAARGITWGGAIQFLIMFTPNTRFNPSSCLEFLFPATAPMPSRFGALLQFL